MACFAGIIHQPSKASLDVSEWQLRRDRDDIQVYRGDVRDSSYDAVRAVTTIENTSVEALAAFLTQSESCPEWSRSCKESYIIEQQSPTEALVYSHNNLPFPFKDRDVVSQVEWQQDESGDTISLISHAVVGVVEEYSDRVRLTHAEVNWRFTTLDNGRVRIENTAHINPGNSLPSWLTNMLLIDTPYQSLKVFREVFNGNETTDVE